MAEGNILIRSLIRESQEGKLQGGELLLNNFQPSCSQQKVSWLRAPKRVNLSQWQVQNITAAW